MKFKYILILVFSIFFSCNDDKSEQISSDQSFTNQYNGVVWQNDIWNISNSSEQPKYLIFNKDISFTAISYNPNKICEFSGIIKVGNVFIDSKIIKITNKKDFFSMEAKFNGTESVFTDSFTISSNGNKMLHTFLSGSETYNVPYTRIGIANPCN